MIADDFCPLCSWAPAGLCFEGSIDLFEIMASLLSPNSDLFNLFDSSLWLRILFESYLARVLLFLMEFFEALECLEGGIGVR